MMTEIKIVVNGQEFTDWLRYEIESDLLQPADAFSLTAPNDDGQMAGVVKDGDLVQVFVAGELQMVGYVDDVNYRCSPDSGASVEIVGRDLFSFLVDCSAELVSKWQITLHQLVKDLSGDWIETWIKTVKDVQIAHAKVEPGDMVWDVLSRFAKQENLLLWLSADGKGKIGKPNYNQEPLYSLYLYPKSSDRCVYNNIINQDVRTSGRDKYASITVYGTSGNTRASYGSSSRKKAVAIDEGVQQKRPLIISDGDVKTLGHAQDKADLEVARRRFDGTRLGYTVKGHHGKRENKEALYQIDTLADVDDKLSDHRGTFYITRRQFRGDSSGQFTELELHPKGEWLS